MGVVQSFLTRIRFFSGLYVFGNNFGTANIMPSSSWAYNRLMDKCSMLKHLDLPLDNVLANILY